MLGDKQEAKFRGVMGAQNTHHIPTVYHVFGSFRTLISVFIALYLILGFLRQHLEAVRRLEEVDWRA